MSAARGRQPLIPSAPGEATPGIAAGTAGASPQANPWWREVALFIGAYTLYSLARGISRGSAEDALANAAHVVALQARLGLNVERAVQDWATELPATQVLGWLYLVAQLIAVPLALALVYRRRRSAYPLLRTTLLGAWLIAIPVYALFPTAPPRLAGIGIADVVSRESLVPLDSPLVAFFYNPVAAVPSLHAAFAVAIGVGLAGVVRHRLLRAAALLWGPLIILVVIATGNHFVLDVVAGLLVVSVAFVAAVLLHGPPPPTIAAEELHAYLAAGPDRAGPLRIALVCPYAWDSHGGVATHVRGLAATLRARGHDVDILAPADRPLAEPGLRLLGRTVGVPHNGSIGRVALGPGAALRSLRAVRRGHYDVVHLHEPLVPSTCLTILLFASTPCVGTFHMYGPDSPLYRALAGPGRIAARRLRARIAVSQAASDCAAGFLGGTYEVIPNGIDPVPAPERRAEPGRSCRVLFVGRPDIRKGLPVLLDALPALPPEVRLDLVGVSPEELHGLAPELPGDALARIHAHGRATERRRLELLSQADMLCAPSVSGESFGLVLVEAMSAGVAVVATAIPGYVEVLDGCGVVVPPGDAPALAAAISRLARDAAAREALAAAGRRRAADYSWERVVDRLVPVYRRVLNDAGAGAGATRPGDPRSAAGADGLTPGDPPIASRGPRG